MNEWERERVWRRRRVWAERIAILITAILIGGGATLCVRARADTPQPLVVARCVPAGAWEANVSCAIPPGSATLTCARVEFAQLDIRQCALYYRWALECQRNVAGYPFTEPPK